MPVLLRCATAIGCHDPVEERECRIAAVHHTRAVAFDALLQYGTLIGLASGATGDIDADRDRSIHFEVGVKPPLHPTASGRAFEERCLRHLRQCRKKRAVHDRHEPLDVLEPGIPKRPVGIQASSAPSPTRSPAAGPWLPAVFLCQTHRESGAVRDRCATASDSRQAGTPVLRQTA